MKKILYTLALLVSFSSFGQTFCDGWEAGYEKGLESCMKIGMTPNCPTAKILADTYGDGYGLGYKKAKEKCNDENPSSTSGAYTNPQFGTTDYTAFSKGFEQGFNNTMNMMNMMKSYYSNLELKGTSTYLPNPRKNKRPFKRLNVKVNKGFASLDINYESPDDDMYFGYKFILALRDKNIFISPSSPYKFSVQYSYRADTGCGGVVIEKLSSFVTDIRNNQKVLSINFSQGNLEGKCIDDVIFQATNRIFEQLDRFSIGNYETALLEVKSDKSNNNKNISVYDEMIKLKELLDLGIITESEFEKKIKELKKKILD